MVRGGRRSSSTTCRRPPVASTRSPLLVEETTGNLHLVYRDVAGGGALVHLDKPAGAPSFSFVTQLYPPSLANNDYLRPSTRGALFPSFNRCEQQLGISVRHGTQAPFAMEYVDVAADPSVTIVGSGCAGSGGFVPTLFVTAGTITPNSNIQLQIAQGLGGSLALLLAGTGTGTTPINPSCSLNITGWFRRSCRSPSAGRGRATAASRCSVRSPNIPVGSSFGIQAFVADPGVPPGFSNTHGLKLVVQ